MEMSLINAGLAAGAGLAALPLILHLFMRQTPKHVIFPALRLVRERQRRSKKRLRVKNWLLLLARMAILALMALALSRPTLYSQVPLGDQSVPTALGLVFDTSLSMKYKDRDRTRLEEAKERAREIVEKLPDSSQVFVVDSSEAGSTGLSPAAALKRIDELTIHSVSRPLNVAMGEVYDKIVGIDKPARAVYVLTDLAKTAWVAGPAEGLDKVEKLKKEKKGRMATFVLRLTPKEIQNLSVVTAEPSSSVVTQGEAVAIRSRLHFENSSEAPGQPPARRTVEYFIDGVKKGEKLVEIPPKGDVEVDFPSPPNLKEGELHRGEIALRGAPDPFEDDDRRYFSFKVRPPLKVLLVTDRPGVDDFFVDSALVPDPSPKAPQVYKVERRKTSDLRAPGKTALSEYACIFLLNAASIDEASWGALSGYVREGGGLVIGAGSRCDPASYDTAVAGQILPGALDRIVVLEGNAETHIGKVVDVTHPLFESYGQDLATELAQVPIYRYWSLRKQDPPIDGARTLLSYDDGTPCLLERTIQGPKAGRVFLWTTPLSRSAKSRGPDAWSEFPVKNWSFWAMMWFTVPYMAGTTEDTLNFEAGGAPVMLHLEPTARYKSFTLVGPGPEAKPSPIALPPSRGDLLEIAMPPQQQPPGQWTVKAVAEGDRPVTLGFSFNPPRAESQFNPMEKADLDAVFGKDGYLFAEDADKLKEIVDTGRFGTELFPFLMFLILLVVTLESILANTFYKEAPKAGTSPAAA